MKRQLQKAMYWVLCVLLTATFVACSSKAALTSADRNRMQELGSEFMEEIKAELLRHRESPQSFKKQDVVLVFEDKTYHAEKLRSFYEDYRVGQDAQVTFVISNKGFVTSRVVVEGGAGYYFRYEYDPFNQADLTITSQSLDEIKLVEDVERKKLELHLFRVKKDPVVYTFRNIVDEA